MSCCFVPPYLLRRLADQALFPRAGAGGQHTLELDRELRDAAGRTRAAVDRRTRGQPVDHGAFRPQRRQRVLGGSQLVFGDGDGMVFDRFTKPGDVMAHEFTRGVIQFTAGSAYQDQSGALNESISDVFAAMTEQFSRSQTVDQADWLIGEGLFLPAVNGRDPQVGRMADYVATTDDNGGVHINSGFPNRAFALAATDTRSGPAAPPDSI